MEPWLAKDVGQSSYLPRYLAVFPNDRQESATPKDVDVDLTLSQQSWVITKPRKDENSKDGLGIVEHVQRIA
jgi:hypothetical protein